MSAESRNSIRKFLVLQAVLVTISLGMRAFFWASQTSTVSTVNLLAAVLIAGNIGNALFTFSQPLFRRIPQPWSLVAQMGSLATFGVSAGLLTQIVAFHIYAKPGSHFAWGGRDVRLSLFLIITINCGLYLALFIYIQMKERLEARNRELQGQVQLGQIQQQAQEAELASAHEIQKHLLPRETPQIEGFQIACAWQPAKAVGGDYFDVFPVGEGRLGLCLADVSGKGITAALLMANLQASVKAFAQETITPAALCGRLNGVLCSNIAPGKFVTFFYGIVDQKTRTMVYENAGHCSPLVVHADGSVEIPPSVSGVLGLFSEWTFQNSEMQLRPGDCLLLLTDGVLEAADKRDEEFGYERLTEVVKRNRSLGAHGLRKKILEEVSAFCDGIFQDDASLILVTVD